METLAVEKNKLYKPKSTYRYKYPSGARASVMPRYPRPAVIIDYVLTDTLDAPIALEIINEKDEVINTLFSNNKEKSIPESVIENMSTNETEFIVDNSLSTNLGFNRYKWYMTESGPWHENENRRYKNGPYAAPGNYTLRMTIDGTVMEQSFKLLEDPRTTDKVTTSEINEQMVLARQVKELLSEVRKELSSLEEKKSALLKKKDKSIADENQLKDTSTLISLLKTKEGIYEKPQLIAQISYLYNQLNDADQLPGKDTFDRYEDLLKLWKEINMKTK